MKDLDQRYLGRLVYLTVHVNEWLRQANPTFNVPMSNRIAKVIKVFDWESDEGKILLKEREKTGKWGNLNSKDFKFVLDVYFPDLTKGSQVGIRTPELFPKRFPGTELSLFELLPGWMVKSLMKENEGSFNIVKKDKNLKKGRTNRHNIEKRPSGASRRVRSKSK